MKTIRKAALRRIAFATLAGALLLATFPAGAQPPLTKDQCYQAMAVVDALTTKYNGRISADFIKSIKTFVARDCDMDVEFKVIPGTSDKDAFGEFRLKITAIKTAEASKRRQ